MADKDVKTRVRGLSYSAISKYAECGERFRLSRVYGMDKSTWFVTVMGTAVHFVTENYDRVLAGARPLDTCVTPDSFHEVFDRELRKLEAWNYEIKASGRELKAIGKSGGPNKKDREWCEYYGPQYIQSWIDWRRTNNLQVAFLPDGALGIECELSNPIGGYPFKGFIDRLFIDGDGNYVVVDLKTGNAPPGDMQLQAYACALRDAGVDVSRAGYWIASEGRVTRWVDTPASGDPVFRHMAATAGRGIEAGVFLPNVTSMCVGCGVRDYCAAVGGSRADLIPLETPPITIGEVQVDGNGELI